MPGTKVILAESAVRDLEAIRAWFDEQGLADTGINMVRDVLNQIEALADHPDLGRVVPEFGKSFLRELVRPPLRIVYRRNALSVKVVRVWRAERRLILPPDVSS